MKSDARGMKEVGSWSISDARLRRQRRLAPFESAEEADELDAGTRERLLADLFEAVDQDDEAEVEELITDAGAEVDSCDANGRTALMRACAASHTDIVTLLVTTLGANLARTDCGGADALIWACHGGSVEVAEILVDARAALDVADGLGNTPLIHAAQRGHADLAVWLAERGASSSVVNTDGQGAVVAALAAGHASCARRLSKEGAICDLASACVFGDLEIISRSLEDHSVRATINSASSLGGCTPLMLAAAEGHTGAVEVLMAHGATVTARDFDGGCPLLWACEFGRVDAAAALVRAHADLESRDEDGTTPLMRASARGHTELVEWLLSRGASHAALDVIGRHALISAARDGREAVLRLLLKAGMSVSLADHHGGTALHMASARGHVEAAMALLEAGAPCNARDHNLETPLMLACEFGHTLVAVALHHAGADAGVTNIDGDSVLGVAISGKHVATVQAILSSDPTLDVLRMRDARGRTPLMQAAIIASSDLVAALLDAGVPACECDEDGHTALSLAEEDEMAEGMLPLLRNAVTEQLHIPLPPPVPFEKGREAQSTAAPATGHVPPAAAPAASLEVAPEESSLGSSPGLSQPTEQRGPLTTPPPADDLPDGSAQPPWMKELAAKKQRKATLGPPAPALPGTLQPEASAPSSAQDAVLAMPEPVGSDGPSRAAPEPPPLHELSTRPARASLDMILGEGSDNEDEAAESSLILTSAETAPSSHPSSHPAHPAQQEEPALHNSLPSAHAQSSSGKSSPSATSAPRAPPTRTPPPPPPRNPPALRHWERDLAPPPPLRAPVPMPVPAAPSADSSAPRMMAGEVPIKSVVPTEAQRRPMPRSRFVATGSRVAKAAKAINLFSKPSKAMPTDVVEGKPDRKGASRTAGRTSFLRKRWSRTSKAAHEEDEEESHDAEGRSAIATPAASLPVINRGAAPNAPMREQTGPQRPPVAPMQLVQEQKNVQRLSHAGQRGYLLGALLRGNFRSSFGADFDESDEEEGSEEDDLTQAPFSSQNQPMPASNKVVSTRDRATSKAVMQRDSIVVGQDGEARHRHRQDTI